MKIYFAGSIRGGREDAKLYGEIIKELQLYGEVLTEHIGSAVLTPQGETEKQENFIYRRDTAWLDQADRWACATQQRPPASAWQGAGAPMSTTDREQARRRRSSGR